VPHALAGGGLWPGLHSRDAPTWGGPPATSGLASQSATASPRRLRDSAGRRPAAPPTVAAEQGLGLGEQPSGEPAVRAGQACGEWRGETVR
jgi:hypothetical protein